MVNSTNVIDYSQSEEMICKNHVIHNDVIDNVVQHSI